MDALALLSLQIEWGADEALASEPISRLLTRPAAPWAVPAPIPAPPVPDPLPRPAVIPARSQAVIAARGPMADACEAAARAGDLDALRSAIVAFSGCALRETATNPVLPSGDPSRGLAIVGEVPDDDEDRSGTPFAGRSGQLLDRMLASIGLDRSGLLLLPLIPWRPPGNRQPSTLELSICQPFLERALLLARPAHLLLMGSRPSRLIAGSTIRANAGWRKPVLPGLPETSQALAMRHPSYLLSHLPARREAWTDLLRLHRILDMPSQPQGLHQN